MASILDYLAIPDLLVMARTGHRMQEMVYDDTRWVKRLRSMGVWNEDEARRSARRHIVRELREHPDTDAATTSVAESTCATVKSEQYVFKNGFAPASTSKLLTSGEVDTTTYTTASHALSVLSRTRSNRGSARNEFGKIYAALNPYYLDIFKIFRAYLANPASSLTHSEIAQIVLTQQELRLFSIFKKPEEQAQILSQLYQFAQGDLALGCYNRFSALASVVAAYEEMALHSFKRSIDANDIDNGMARYARVLVILDRATLAIHTFIAHNPLLQSQTSFGNPIDCFDNRNTAGSSISFQPLHEFFCLLSKSVMEQLDVVWRVFPHNEVDDAAQSFLACVADKILNGYVTTLLDVASNWNQETFVRTVPMVSEYCIRLAEALMQHYEQGQGQGQGQGQELEQEQTSPVTPVDEIFRVLVVKILTPHIKSCLRKELEHFSHIAEAEVKAWEKRLLEEQASTESFFRSNVDRQDVKRDFLSSFRKVVMMPVGVVSGAPLAVSSPASGGRASSKPVSSAHRQRSSLFLSNTPSSPNRAVSPQAGDLPRTELAAKAAIMNFRLQGISTLFSIEVALNIVHRAKASIERMAVFVRVSGALGDMARRQCEAVFVQLLQTLGTGHVKTGFDRAVAHLAEYKPRAIASFVNNGSNNGTKDTFLAPDIDPAALIVNDRSNGTSGGKNVTPLIIFLELVNVGDLIQQMLDVFYSQELVANRLIDQDDFLNSATKEKKRFEQMLDERVAVGLNKGIDVLMAEVELICATAQNPADYNPNIAEIGLPSVAASTLSGTSAGNRTVNVSALKDGKGAYAEPLDVGPTKAARAVVALVSSHTDMLIGSTERTMLDVFNQEVGLRLFGQLCQHIKRQRISTNGAIKLIRYATNCVLWHFNLASTAGHS